jgi:hypothetical protein
MTSSRSCSLLATLVLTSSSRLRAPKTRISRPLATIPSSALDEKKPQSQSTTRYKGQPPPPPSAAHLSAATTHPTRTSHHDHTADHSSSAIRQQHHHQQYSEPSQTSPFSSSWEKRPLLQPYDLSRRLIALCERGDVNLAVTALQRAPRNAQNIKVWNTIIQQCMSAKKYKLAYTVFTDVCIISFPPFSSPPLSRLGLSHLPQWLTKHMCVR